MKFNHFKSISAILLLASSVAFAKNQQIDHAGQINDDKQLVAAVEAKEDAYYVEAGNLVTTKLLPDDTKGNPHQKWQARLSNGTVITVVYNSDMGDRVPIEEGDTFGAGGQFISQGKGGILHWVHADPKNHRPDGYVYLKGVVYGDIDAKDTKH